MNGSVGLQVKSVSPGGIGSVLGIRPGDRILSINGLDLRDEIDYRFLLTARSVRIRILSSSVGERELRLHKNWDEGLGLELESFPIRSCNNRCLFCFVDQMPRGLRPSLYFKDEDYRLSFLHGNYVTLTNLLERDWERIGRQRLSPLFISVHATDMELRRFLLGNPKAPDVMAQLVRLARARIQMHLQVVICPGLNDGAYLKQTIEDLATLRPFACSLSLVPVGLTAHREGLYPLRSLSLNEAEQIEELAKRYRRRFQKMGGGHFLHLSDELYLLAGRAFPGLKGYEGFPQLENGVGLCRQFLSEFQRRERKLPASIPKERSFLLITGELASTPLRPVVSRLNEIRNLRIEMISLPNTLFGPTVTVAGLLSGKDIQDLLKRTDEGWDVLIPDSVLREQEGAFLDDLTPFHLSYGSKGSIIPVPNRVSSLLHVLLGEREGGQR